MLDRSVAPKVHMMGNLVLPVPNTESLDSGITLYSLNGGSQDVNQLSLMFNGGQDEAPNPFVATIMANVLREGTKHMSGAQIAEAIDFNGAMLRIAPTTHQTIVSISSLNSKIIDVLPILNQIIAEPTFPRDAFNVFRDIEAREFELSQTKVMTLAMQQLSLLIKGFDNPQAQIGSVEMINSVTDTQVREYGHRVLTADGCSAFLSGKLTDGVYQSVRDMLTSLSSTSKALPLKVTPYVAEVPGRSDIELPGAVQAAICMGMPAPSRSDADYVPLRFTVTALGGYFGSRLMKNIREDKGYTYGIGAYLLGSREGSYMLINAQCDKSYVEPVIDEVRKEMRRLAEVPLSDEELMRLRQYISSSLMETLDSPFSIMEYYKIINSVGFPKGYFADQVRWAKEINQDVIIEMARRYIDPDNLRIAVCS